MFKRVLIANRGEIAVRISRTLREMGVSPVTVCSDVDRHALHVRACDAAVEIGPGPSRESYLVTQKIIDAAKQLGAEAIHPGYGFLSEKPELPRACKEAGITFIGPPESAVVAMGSKISARELMKKAGVPVVPGTDGAIIGGDEEILKAAKMVGFPIMIKAVNGGGGKGMRLVRSEDEIVSSARMARSEAKSAFNDDAIYMERFVERPRHVEIQVFCDAHGHGVYFGERDCSLQRRNQKIIEESPSTAVDAKLRARMGEVAVKGALSVGYVGAGTMEFLLDPHGNFFFLEMNTRLQVEHPVTEAVFGVDLVREQVRIAAGEKLGYDQTAISSRGHAVEVRIYAEDPEQNFMPSPGRLTYLDFPAGPGIRVDAGVTAHSDVPMFYDPMIAKITCWAGTREHAIARTRRALRETRVGGIKTNIAYLDALLAHPTFVKGDVHTGFIPEHHAELSPHPSERDIERAVIAAAIERDLHAGTPTSTSAPTNDEGAWQRAGRHQGLLRGFFQR